jgi:protein-L-isoaspartate(D-aspartate) O-methyltransferase
MSSAGMAFANDSVAARREMVDEIGRLSRLVAKETGQAALDERVLEAMGRVPRHEFVPSQQRHAAYRNRPLSIGSRQTISQPFIVALMTDLLAVEPGDVVLEIGTGSGYQAAVLAELARDVYSIEIVESLGKQAAATLKRLGYANVHTRIGDGYQGWPEHAPYDSIIVTAAPDHVPPALVEQLKPGGRLVIPVGKLAQELMVITKNEDGTTTKKEIVPVQFVPLTRDKD